MEGVEKKRLSKKKRIAIVIGSIVAVLLVAAVLYGFVFTRSGYWLISKFTPDTEEQKMAFSSASDTTQTIADEGFVLMKNDDDLLPLATSENEKQVSISLE